MGAPRDASEAPFRPIEWRDGYLPIEDHGLLGDGTTAALVGRDGAITWMCVPRFDSEALFAGILDHRRGGAFTVAPEGLTESRQYYDGESAVLVTELRGPDGVVRVTDALTLRPEADLTEDAPVAEDELLRAVRVLAGRVRLRVEIEPRGGGVCSPGSGGRMTVRCDGRAADALDVASTVPLQGTRSVIELVAGDELFIRMRWSRPDDRRASPPGLALERTVDAWHRWARHIRYEGPQAALVRRSAITLKALDDVANGAMVAAPTSSLPESIGGPRNWDYRYVWIRDAAFSVYALHRIGLSHEAEDFLGWVLRAVERRGAPRVMYDLDGNEPPEEVEDAELEGYRGSRPVRWGNAAAKQRQHDVFGEILDCAYQWARYGGEIGDTLWAHLVGFVEEAAARWDAPDHGIWEVRSAARPFTYSAALCQVALDRGARLAEAREHYDLAARWARRADEVRDAILREAWDPDRRTLTEHLGPAEGGAAPGARGGLDASLLTLPLRRVIPADDPRMVATTRAIRDRLGAGNGLLYRYLPEESPDGVNGEEGAFLLCSFWLVDNLAYQGRLDEAHELYASLCARGGTLGLLPEEIDPGTGSFLGNFPQAFSHVGVISSGVNLGRLEARMHGEEM